MTMQLNHTVITEVTIQPNANAPLLQCVDEAAQLAADTGVYVVLRCINKEWLFTPRTTTQYLDVVRAHIIAYEKNNALQLSFWRRNHDKKPQTAAAV